MDNTRNPTSARRSKKRASRSRVPWLLAVLLCIWTKTVVPSFLALCLRAGDEVTTSLAVSTHTHIHIYCTWALIRTYPPVKLHNQIQTTKLDHINMLADVPISPSRGFRKVGFRITEIDNDLIVGCTMTRPTKLEISSLLLTYLM